MTKETILKNIAKWQEVQKRNHPDSAAWQEASERLAPLFSLMAGTNA
jgi:hypothetical protein